MSPDCKTVLYIQELSYLKIGNLQQCSDNVSLVIVKLNDLAYKTSLADLRESLKPPVHCLWIL